MSGSPYPRFVYSDGKPCENWLIYDRIKKQKTNKPCLRFDDEVVYPINQPAIDVVVGIYEIMDAFESSRKICMCFNPNFLQWDIYIDGENLARNYGLGKFANSIFEGYEKNINREEKCEFPDSCSAHIYQSGKYRPLVGNVDKNLLIVKDVCLKDLKKLPYMEKSKNFLRLTLRPRDTLPYEPRGVVSVVIPDECWNDVVRRDVSSKWYDDVFTKEQRIEYKKRFENLGIEYESDVENESEDYESDIENESDVE